MAGTYTKTITLGLDYSNFSGSIKQCNQQMKLLEAEFKNANASLDENATMSDRAALYVDKLTQQINIQAAKADAAKKKYEDLVNAHADTSRIDAAKTAWLNEDTALKQLQQSFDYAGISYEQFLGIAAAGIATIAAVSSAFIDCAKSAAEYADAVNTMSQQSGASTEMVQTWQYMGEVIDVSAETMAGAMSKLKKKMGDAVDGSKSAESAFKELGVQIQNSDGSLRDASDVMYDVFDALADMSNETEKDAAAMDIFGKSADSLAGAIDGGRAAFEQYNQMAKDAGYIMSNEDLEASNALSDAMELMNNKVEAVKNQIGSGLAPVLTVLANLFNAIPTPVMSCITVIGGVAAVVVAGTVAIIALNAALTMIPPTATAAAASLGVVAAEVGVLIAEAAPLLILVAAIVAIGVALGNALVYLDNLIQEMGGFNAVIDQVISNLDRMLGVSDKIASVGNSFREFWQGVIDVINAVTEAIQNLWNAFSSAPDSFGDLSFDIGSNAGGTDSWRGGLTMVGEDGPELVSLPQGSRIYNSSETRNMTGNTYNISMNCDLSRMKSVNDVVNAINGLNASVGCGGIA